MESLNDIYFGKRKPKDKPWKYSSNRSMRIACAILEMICAKLFPQVYNEDLIRWKPGEITDFEKVERINKLMNWWIRVRAKMREFFDNWIMSCAGYGDVTTEVSWEVKYKDKGEKDITYVKDEEGNILDEIEEKRLSIFETTKVAIISKENVFLRSDAQDLEEDPIIIKDEYLYGKLEEMEAQGKLVNVQNLVKPNLLNKIQIGENTNVAPEELERLKEIKLRVVPVKILKWFGKYDYDGDGFSEDVRILVDLENRIYIGGVEIKNISKRAIRPINRTKFLPRLDDVDGMEGMGILELTDELAREIDAIFNQMTDANTISVLRPGFYDPSGDLNAPTISLAPNKLTPLTDPTKNVFFPDFKIQIDNLLKAIRAVMEFIERLTAASSYVMGKESEIVGGSGTATRTQAIVMAAEERFQRPALRLKAGAARILTLVLDQLQLNIPPGLEKRVLGEKNEPIFKENELTDEGISGEFDAYLLEDASGGSKNIEREVAGFLYGQLLQNPLIATDPVKIYKATFDLIAKHTSVEYAENFLGPRPEEKDTDSPQDENTLMIQGEFNKVRALMPENHIWHLQIHQGLNESPTLLTLPEGIRNQVLIFNQNHMQEHTMMMQAMMQQMLKIGGQVGIQGTANAPQGSEKPFGVGASRTPLGRVMSEKRAGESKPTP
jgi:hypothetical protein